MLVFAQHSEYTTHCQRGVMGISQEMLSVKQHLWGRDREHSGKG